MLGEGTLESKIEDVKLFYTTKIISRGENISVSGAPRPLGAAFDGLDTPGPCASAPRRCTPARLQSYTSVGVRRPPRTSAAVTRGGPALFFPTCSFRCHKKKGAHIVVNIWWYPPGYVRTSSWAIPSSVFPSAKHGSIAHRKPLHPTKGRKDGLAGALLM